MKYKIDFATQDNLKSVAKYINTFLSLNLEGISLRPNGMPQEEVKQKLPKSLECGDKLCLVAQVEQEIVGCLTFSRHPKIEYRHCGEFGMTILPEYWKKGIGSAFIIEMEKWCMNQNINKIELGVWSNNIAAINLYKKHGYEVEGQRKRAIKRESQFYDLILKAKWLG